MNHKLHTHPKLEGQLGLDDNHVIVDKNDWLEVLSDLGQVREYLDQVPENPMGFAVSMQIPDFQTIRKLVRNISVPKGIMWR